MSLIPRTPIILLLLLISALALQAPADGQSWRERPTPEREMSGEEENRAMKGALRAGFVAILFAALIYLFTQDGTMTAFAAFFIYLATSAHLVIGLLLGVGSVWMAFQTKK